MSGHGGLHCGQRGSAKTGRRGTAADKRKNRRMRSHFGNATGSRLAGRSGVLDLAPISAFLFDFRERATDLDATMSINAIRYFLEVVRSGSIREASERLNVAPSALSRQIQNLELELNMPLFERKPRGMVLTAAGEVYARYSQTVILEDDRVRSDLEELRGLRRGVVRIATVEGVVADMLTAVVAAFRAQNPGIRFNLVAMGTDDVVASVRDGRTDIGISFHAQPDAAVRFVRRQRDPLSALVHPDHALAGREQITLLEILSHPTAGSGAGLRHSPADRRAMPAPRASR